MSRYSPPPRRRVVPAERSSTGSLAYGSRDPYYSSSIRDSYTQPRASGTTSRVIPLSTERYVNGVPVSTIRHEGYDTYADRPQRTVYQDEVQPRRSAGLGAVSSSAARPAASSTLPDRSVAASRPRDRDHRDYYDAPAASSGTRSGHKKTHSIDDTRPARVADDRDRGYRRGDEADRAILSSRTPRRAYADDEYEYMDLSRMYTDTEPQWRPHRRGSADAGSRRDAAADRRSSVVEQPPSRATARNDGPPPATRALDRLNDTGGRRASLRDAPIAQPRQRKYDSQSEEDGYQDDGYNASRKRVPRKESLRDDVRDRPRQSHGEDYDDYDERPDDRRPGRKWEDPELTKRGFGIRTGDVDPDYERMSSHDVDPSGKTRSRRDNALDSRREREIYDERPERTTRHRDEADDVRRPRDEQMHDLDRRGKVSADTRTRRERDDLLEERRLYEDRGGKSHRRREGFVDDRRPDEVGEFHEKAPSGSRGGRAKDSSLDERSERYKDDDDDDRRPQRKMDGESSGETGTRDRHDKIRDDVPAEALAGAAAVGAGVYGTEEVLDRRRRHKSRDVGGDQPSDRGEDRKPERHRKTDLPAANQEPASRERRVEDEESPDLEKTLRRHYIDPDEVASSDTRGMVAEPLDPDEEYRQRIKLEAERVRHVQNPGESNEDGADHERERQRRHTERQARRARDRDEPGHSPELVRDSSSFDTDAAHSTALARYNETSEPEDAASRQTRLVEASERKDAPKGILRRPTEKFPEHPNQTREGVAPLQPINGVPADARWTKINRNKVSPQALKEAGERFEERKDVVVVLRVVALDQIHKWAARTQEIRDERYERHRRERLRLKERGEQSSSGSENEEEHEERREEQAAKAQLEWHQ